MNHPAGTDRPQMEGTITCPHCGQVLAEASDVVVEVDLPFAALMFKEKVEKAIAKNITRALQGPA